MSSETKLTAQDVADIYAFIQRQYDKTACVCKPNAICGMDVSCIHCAAAAVLSRARGEEPAGGAE